MCINLLEMFGNVIKILIINLKNRIPIISRFTNMKKDNFTGE